MCDNCTEIRAENRTHDFLLMKQEYVRIIAKSTVIARKVIGVTAKELITFFSHEPDI